MIAVIIESIRAMLWQMYWEAFASALLICLVLALVAVACVLDKVEVNR